MNKTMMRMLLISIVFALVVALAAASPSMSSSNSPLFSRYMDITRRTIDPARKDIVTRVENFKRTFDAEQARTAINADVILRGGANDDKPSFPRKLLAGAYTACSLATTAAWSTVVYTTIRSNQPEGMMMPTWQHGYIARLGAFSAIPMIGAAYKTLACSANKADSWEDLDTPTCRRHNLALATAGAVSALWTGFAPLLTKLPGTTPLVSHQSYTGLMRTGLIGCYASGAALGAAVWARSLPEDVRHNPLAWPGRIADGVCKSLVSLLPASVDDPVNVKYALLTSSFLVFTGLQLGSHPLSVIPSWTGRRLARAFPAWTLLGAVTSFDLKEATENGTILTSDYARTLSNGLKAFGVTYIAAKTCAVCFDPSFPEAYHAVKMVPGWATAAVLMVGLSLRSDEKLAKYYIK